MIQKIKKNMRALILTVGLVVPMMAPGVALAVSPVVANADVTANLCNGSNFTINSDALGSANSCGTTNTDSVNTLLKKVVNIISAVVGVIAVIMIVVGGFKYITSGGESSNVSGAKNTIIYAIIGLVIVALAQVIVHFVLNQSASLT